MNEFRQFRVIPCLPENLVSLRRIAQNLWMAWNPKAIKLFMTMDGELWERCQHNPIRMLGEIGQERLEELNRDEGFLLELQRVNELLEQYLQVVNSLQHREQIRIAYFSAEYGLNDTLPIYSGGLGILSGDHIKSASDLNLNFFGVGILYQQGYFQQYLNQEGWQQDFYQVNDFPNMQVQEVLDAEQRPVQIEIELPGRSLQLKAWKIEVGRVNLLLLDANLPANSPADRQLTAQLYGGDQEIRLQQEMILGIGGVRLLERLGVEIDVLHMNEGHSAFAPFERMALLMERYGLEFPQAVQLVRKSTVFTTHTNVQAGHDAFPPDLIRRYLKTVADRLHIPLEDFLRFGRSGEGAAADSFSMTVAAIHNSSFINGVSKLHSQVARKLWQHLWKEIPIEHVPVTAITNGVHIPSWLSFEMNNLYERYLGAKWREKQDYKDAWERVLNLPDTELWSVKELRRRRLIAFTRQRLEKQLRARGATKQMIDDSQEALDPDVLTIGFARRFATYKRSNLILSDPERLLALLNDSERPIQLIFAGKAHPQDQAGKELIRNIMRFKATHGVWKKIVFIEDYDFNVARYMLQGVDLWLNNPLRPLEACGTSGMKAACNGALNLSILDGWWDEAYDLKNGWAIGNREQYPDAKYQDEVESRALYSVLENDIIPQFYNRTSDGLPREWIRMMKYSLFTIASRFNSHRMVKEYFYRFYRKAAENFLQMRSDEFQLLRSFTTWKETVDREFNAVRIVQIDSELEKVFRVTEEVPLGVELDLGRLKPEDVRVDAYLSPVLGGEMQSESEIERLAAVEHLAGHRYRFSGSIPCKKTGRFGFRIRVTPDHPLLTDPYELNQILWG